MSSAGRAGTAVAPATVPRSAHRLRRLAATGVVAILAAVVLTTLAAALAEAAGVDFVVPEGGETIPLSGIAFVTGVFSAVGVVIAAVLLRWTSRPDVWFVRTTVSLTAVSLVPPIVSGAEAATIVALIGLHLVAASVMIPALTRRLRC